MSKKCSLELSILFNLLNKICLISLAILTKSFFFNNYNTVKKINCS